jgi:hypothetical protein
VTASACDSRFIVTVILSKKPIRRGTTLQGGDARATPGVDRGSSRLSSRALAALPSTVAIGATITVTGPSERSPLLI